MDSIDSTNPKTLLITGGCGFIGNHLIRMILRDRPRWRIINVDKLTYAGNDENLADLKAGAGSRRYRFLQADIADAGAMSSLFDNERVDAVVNLAAETHVDRSIMDSAPFIKTNVEGTRVLLDVAAHYRLDRFLQVSTDEVYGSLGSEDPPFTEQSPLMPNSPYAASKAAADLLIRAYHRSFDLPVLITRSGNNYGPYQFPEKFLPLCITNALEDRPVPIYGTGRQIRDWLHVEDHARALIVVLEKGEPGEIYNISAGEEQENYRMAEWILAALGKPKGLINFVKDRPGHDVRYALNATKIRDRLGWRPTVSLDEGLKATVDWYREHRDWWERIKSGDYQHYYKRWYGDRLAGS